MVHFVHASVDFTTMMRPVWLIAVAVIAPLGSTVWFTNIHIFSIKVHTVFWFREFSTGLSIEGIV